LGDVNQISVCCVSIAQVYRAQHKYSLALATLNQALLILDDQPVLAAGVDNGMAETFFEMREYRRAIEYAELGVQIAQKSNAAETVAKGAQILARSYAMLGDFERAYDYQQLYATTAALLRNDEVQEKVAAAEANYKAAKQETRLIALNKDREQTVLRLIATAIGFVFLVLVVLLLVRTLAAQRRANAEITRQQQILEEQATQIELSNAQLQEKNLALDSVNAALLENNQQLELYVKMLSDANSKVQHQISMQQQQALQLQIVNAQLEEKNDQVEHAMRQLKATEAQLVQSERTNAMGMLTAGVMHEINNPNAAVYAATGSLQRKLNAIRTYFLSLIDEADRAAPAIQEMLKLIGEGERAVAVAREGAERVKVIVGTLQHFTKHQREGFGRGRIAEELSSTIELFRFQFKNVVVHTNLDDGTNHTLEIEANFGELNQVFLNFLVNAAQAGATVIRIDVERATLPSGKAALRACIRDNGAGISAEVQHNIFEPFFTTKGAGNTGLGLSISKNVIDRHRGTIDVHSERGKGTTFAVTLPLKHEA
jgi:signal transduction histidine kinase